MACDVAKVTMGTALATTRRKRDAGPAARLHGGAHASMPRSRSRQWRGIRRPETLILMIAMCVGCGTPNRLEESYRIDLHRITSTSPPPSSLTGTGDRPDTGPIVESLIRDLAEVDRIRRSPVQVMLRLHDLAQNANLDDAHFNLIEQQLVAEIMQSRRLRDHFFLTAADTSTHPPNEAEGTEAADPSETSAGEQSTAEKVDGYRLRGELIREDHRGDLGRTAYAFKFTLINRPSNRVIFQKIYDLPGLPSMD